MPSPLDLSEVPTITEEKAMINAQIVNKLHEMRLSAMADAFRHQMSDPKYLELSFENRFGLLVDIEFGKRKSNKLLRLMKKAEFRYPQACIEDIEYHPDRKLDRKRKIPHTLT